MSLAFREVFKDFSTGMKENHSSRDQLFKTDPSHEDSALLYSSDNVRPKSRAKSCLQGNDLQRVILVEKSPGGLPLSKTPENNQDARQKSLTLSPLSTKNLQNCSNNAQELLLSGNEIPLKRGKF